MDKHDWQIPVIITGVAASDSVINTVNSELSRYDKKLTKAEAERLQLQVRTLVRQTVRGKFIPRTNFD